MNRLIGLGLVVVLLAGANGWVFSTKAEQGFLFRPADREAIHGEGSVEAFAHRDEHYDPSELEAARGFLKDAGVLETEPLGRRLHALGALLLLHLDHRRGTPSAAMATRTPWQQFQAADAGDDAVWCTQLQEIYVFFATAAGIPSRPVKVETSTDGGGHSIAESHVESGWVMVDLTSGNVEIRDADGPLSATELLGRWQDARRAEGELQVPAGLTASVGSERAEVPYAQASHSEREYFTADARLIYLYPYAEPNALPRKAYRYLIKPDRVLEDDPSSAKHALKVALFVLGLVAGLTWLGLLGSRLRVRARDDD